MAQFPREGGVRVRDAEFGGDVFEVFFEEDGAEGGLGAGCVLGGAGARVPSLGGEDGQVAGNFFFFFLDGEVRNFVFFFWAV